jgi:hypothetical protein
MLLKQIRRLVADFPAQRSGLCQRGFVVHKVALRLFSSEYSGFPVNHSTDCSAFIIIIIIVVVVHHQGLLQQAK